MGLADIMYRPHYEMEFATEDEAHEEEYLLIDGWSPFIDTAVDGKTLYFADDTNCLNGGGHSKIVADDWWNGKAKFVEP